MCLIHECEELSCPSRVTFIKLNTKTSSSLSSSADAKRAPADKNNSHCDDNTAVTVVKMNQNNIPSPIIPVFDEPKLTPQLQHNHHSAAIAVPHAQNRDVNYVPVSAHRQISDDKCSGMVIGPYNDKYQIMDLINKGSFGRIYRGLRMSTGEQVAIKAEDQGTGHEKIMTEANLCRKLEGCAGIPEVIWYGMYGSEYNFMIMDYLGPNLLQLYESCGWKFSLRTVVKIVLDLLPTLKYLHDNNIMHRDMSPKNIVIGVGPKKEQIYLVDFGLSKRCSRQGQLILPSAIMGEYCNPMVGTPRYSSINTHRGGVVGRSDDLESLGYVLVYLLKGTLPWQDELSDNFIEGIRHIEHLKIVTTVEDLCKGIPDQFATLISYARLLRYYEMPDYKSITTLFMRLVKERSINLEEPYDWESTDSSGDNNANIPRLKRSMLSLPLIRVRGGSDDTIIPYTCSQCTTDSHVNCNSA